MFPDKIGYFDDLFYKNMVFIVMTEQTIEQLYAVKSKI
jgi:hypothetical protein